MRREARPLALAASAANVVDIRSERGGCEGCGECCGRVLPLSAFDVARLRAYVERNRVEPSPETWIDGDGLKVNMMCPFLDEDGRCMVYDARPEMSEILGSAIGVSKVWEHEGLACLIRHGAFGCPCGYVAVPESHPLHGVSYSEYELDVHGGVTFAGDIEGYGWCIGFDMAHYGDLSPVDPFTPVRTDEECALETNRLADQLAEMMNGRRDADEEGTCA